MKIYTISGLGADSRLFQNLQLEGEIINLEWIQPTQYESLKSYALRLAEKINKEEKFVLIGLSFGGMVATEIAKKYKPEKLILISSVPTRKELRPLYRFIGQTQINKLIPTMTMNQNAKLLAKIFGTKEVAVLDAILKGSNPRFTKEFINMILNWNNSQIPENIVRIHGEKDLILPCPQNPDLKIEKGGHLIILDNHKEVSDFIDQKLNSNQD
ncbi:MAG: alpha/beta hydrolase [Crocinitomicaceae bacterium]|nr:alpha/beta hydrolase [Crocinitomicaceae bacterium]